MPWRTAIEVESCALLGSRVGGSWPRSMCRTCWSARSETLGAGVAAGAADAPGAVDAAGGADEVVAPPQAAAMTAMLAKMPKSRFCMDSPPNGLSTRKSLATEVRSRIQHRCVSSSFRSSLPLDTVDGRTAATARIRSVRCRYYPQRLPDCQLPA